MRVNMGSNLVHGHKEKKPILLGINRFQCYFFFFHHPFIKTVTCQHSSLSSMRTSGYCFSPFFLWLQIAFIKCANWTHSLDFLPGCNWVLFSIIINNICVGRQENTLIDIHATGQIDACVEHLFARSKCHEHMAPKFWSLTLLDRLMTAVYHVWLEQRDE